MENNEKKKSVKKVIDIGTEKTSGRNEENFKKNSSSIITSRFDKKHGRSNRSFGDGHEPGTIPGSGV